MTAGQGAAPYPANIPNAETRKALREAAEGENLTEYASLDNLKAGLGRLGADTSRNRD